MGFNNEYPFVGQSNLERIATYLAIEVREKKHPTTIALWGTLGAGKTTFSRAFIKTYLNDPTLVVKSPTFSLIHPYEGYPFDIWHCDFYRILGEEEVLNLGLFDGFDTVVSLIEWPEKIGSYLPSDRIDVFLNIVDEKRRHVTLKKRIHA